MLGVFCYGTLFFRAEPLERDDQSLLTPLLQVHSPASYFEAWRKGLVLDVAPVRDATYLADTAASRLLHMPTYTFTNFILWLVFVALALSLFSALGFGNGALWLLTIVLACHPAYAVTVAWIASRKHLLAGVFCLAATLSFVRRQRGSTAWYVLSVLSHPIYLLWPLWATLYAHCERRPLRQAIPALALLVPLGALNGWYYLYGPYLAASNGLGKFSGAPAGSSALALGRALLNLLFPFFLSPVDYFPGAFANLLGIALLPIFLAAAWNFVPTRKLLPWLAFFFLPLLLLNIRSTRIFLSDTYLLVASLGVWVVISFSVPKRLQRPALAAGLVLALAGLWETRALATSFSSTAHLFALAFEREPTPQVSYVHAKFLFEAGHLREAAEASFAAIPEFRAAESLFAQAVTSDDQLWPSYLITSPASAAMLRGW